MNKKLERENDDVVNAKKIKTAPLCDRSRAGSFYDTLEERQRDFTF